MKLMLEMQLLPSAEQAIALRRVMEVFNEAATYAARLSFDAGAFGRVRVHRLTYRELRSRYGLSAQLATRVIGKVVEAFRRDKTQAPVFRPRGAIPYCDQCISFKGPNAVSMHTLEGRIPVPVVYGEYQRRLFGQMKGQIDLVLRDGRFFLHATADVSEAEPIAVDGFIGVDLGVAAAAARGALAFAESVVRLRAFQRVVALRPPFAGAPVAVAELVAVVVLVIVVHRVVQIVVLLRVAHDDLRLRCWDT